jgi:hypothetical protein
MSRLINWSDSFPRVSRLRAWQGRTRHRRGTSDIARGGWGPYTECITAR